MVDISNSVLNRMLRRRSALRRRRVVEGIRGAKSIKDIAIIILLISGVFFLGRGITGFYLMDFEQLSCSADSECPAGEVCCNFYHENYGLCDLEKNCDAIAAISREEIQATKLKNPDAPEGISTQKFTTQKIMHAMARHYEYPKSRDNIHSLVVGAILLLFALIALYVNRERVHQEKR